MSPVGFEPADSGLRPRALRDRSGNRGKIKLVFLLPTAQSANALLSYVCIYEHEGKYSVKIYNPKNAFSLSRKLRLCIGQQPQGGRYKTRCAEERNAW